MIDLKRYLNYLSALVINCAEGAHVTIGESNQLQQIATDTDTPRWHGYGITIGERLNGYGIRTI